MSVFSYNNVQLPLPNMMKFDRKALYEESNTDWYVTRFEIRLQCFLNLSYLQVVIEKDTAPLSTPSEIMNALWTLLMTPRKNLSYVVQGVELIPDVQIGGSGVVDAMNGPQPQFCNIHQLTPSTFILDYSIIAHYWQNNPSDGTNANDPGNNVLYNRWTEQVVMDEMMRSTKTRKGVLRIRSDNLDQITPDDLRSPMVVVSIPFGFRRIASKYTVSADGLSLLYELVDEEVFKMPPWPAFKAEGYFDEIGKEPGCIFRDGHVFIRLYGSPSTDQSALLYAAWTIGCAKMASNLGAPIDAVWNNPIQPGKQAPLVVLPTPLYTSIRRRIYMWDNIVEVELQAMLNYSTLRIGKAAAAPSSLTFTPGSDDVPTVPPLYYDRGDANLLLQAAAYWDPNAIDATQLTNADLNSNENSVTSVAPEIGSAPRVQLPNGSVPGTGD